MKIIALIPPLPHLPIITCKPYYQLYLLSEHKMPPRFGTPEQTKKGPTPELLEEPGNPLETKKDLHQIPRKKISSSRPYPYTLVNRPPQFSVQSNEPLN